MNKMLLIIPFMWYDFHLNKKTRRVHEHTRTVFCVESPRQGGVWRTPSECLMRAAWLAAGCSVCAWLIRAYNELKMACCQAVFWPALKGGYPTGHEHAGFMAACYTLKSSRKQRVQLQPR